MTRDQTTKENLMPTNATLVLTAADIQPGDQLLDVIVDPDSGKVWGAPDTADEHTVDTVKKHADPKKITVRFANGRSRGFPRTARARVVRTVRTYGDALADALSLLEWHATRSINQARGYDPLAVLDARMAYKGEPDHSPARFLQVMEWDADRFIRDARTAQLWQRVAELVDGGESLESAVRVVANRVTDELMAGPNNNTSSASHRFVDRATWDAGAEFLRDLTGWDRHGTGLLGAINAACADVEERGADRPIGQ